MPQVNSIFKAGVEQFIYLLDRAVSITFRPLVDKLLTGRTGEFFQRDISEFILDI